MNLSSTSQTSSREIVPQKEPRIVSISLEFTKKFAVMNMCKELQTHPENRQLRHTSAGWQHLV